MPRIYDNYDGRSNKQQTKGISSAQFLWHNCNFYFYNGKSAITITFIWQLAILVFYDGKSKTMVGQNSKYNFAIY